MEIVYKSSSKEEIMWYVNQTFKSHWSRRIVNEQFKAHAYERKLIEPETSEFKKATYSGLF